MSAAEALLLAFVGLFSALYYGTALLVVVADLRLPPRVIEIMGGGPTPYRRVRRWVTLAWVGPMTALGILILFAPLIGVRGAGHESALAWAIVAAGWIVFFVVIVLALRRLVTQ